MQVIHTCEYIIYYFPLLLESRMEVEYSRMTTSISDADRTHFIRGKKVYKLLHNIQYGCMYDECNETIRNNIVIIVN